VTPQRVAVIGLGLIGGSIGSALRRQGWYVRGFDRQDAAAYTAEERGLVDELAGSLEAAVQGAAMVILALPIPAIVGLLPSIDAAAEREATIIDTGSVKGPVLSAMSSMHGAHRAVGGHPIAGNERSGPAAATPDLFRRRPFVLCASSATSEATVTQATLLVAALRARPVQMDADHHDQVLARTSHLPQLLSSALALSLAPDDTRLAGPALQDMTRLAASPPELWREILTANRANVASAMRAFVDHCADLTRMIEAGEDDQLAAALTVAGAACAPLLEQAR